MANGRIWTPEDCERLRELWGYKKGGIPAVARAMGRSDNAVLVKAQKLKLGPWQDGGEWVTLNGLFKILSANASHSYYFTRLKQLGIPTVTRRVRGHQYEMVKITEFWKWAQQHQGDLDFSRFEENSLGREPDWCKAKRSIDRQNRLLMPEKKCPWSAEEDALLRQMCLRGTTWGELDGAFQRTVEAVRRRVYDLNLPLPKRGPQIRWTEEDMALARRLSAEGYSADFIALRLGRSANSVRGKLEWMNKRKRGGTAHGLGKQATEESD